MRSYKISEVPVFDEQRRMWGTDVLADGHNGTYHYTCWGATQAASQSRAQWLVSALTPRTDINWLQNTQTYSNKWE